MSLTDIKVQLCSHWGDDRAAAQAAWASSYDKEKAEARNDLDVARVVTGLVHLGHTTPLERVWVEFFVTCPIFIERQLDKARMSTQFQDFRLDYEMGVFGRWGITQNELSGRYRTIPDRPYGMPSDVAEICGRAVFSEDQKHPREQWYARSSDAAKEVKRRFDQILSEQHLKYQAMLDKLREAEKDGVISNAEYKRAREVLRGLLGTAFMTDFRMVMNLNAFQNVISQRLAADAQLESRVVAYHMVMLARKAGVAPTLLDEMVIANNWGPLLVEVQAALHAAS